MKIGILGGGQLARMLVLAGLQMDCQLKVYASPGDNCVEGLCPVTQKQFEDLSALREFISSCDLVTYEWETLPISQLKNALGSHSDRLFPRLDILEVISNRHSQKSWLKSQGLPVVTFCFIDKESELEQAVQKIGMPGILKTTREGYDGRGQKIIHTPKDLTGAWSELGAVPLVYEKLIKFDRELSLVTCRNPQGDMKHYPLVENLHVQGILRRTLAPAPKLNPKMQEVAQNYAHKIGESLKYVGVMALELFQCGESLLINEVASRVHNTGHWTLDGAMTSQFENHLRAGLGLDLGDTRPKGNTAMLNFIGEVPFLAEVIDKMPGLFVYPYGKKPRPNRKVGHLNLTADSFEALSKKLDQIEPLVKL